MLGVGVGLFQTAIRRAGGPPAWTPADLGASLALWLDADDAATVTLNGSNVSQWADKSGNGHHLVQATAAAQPAFVASALNGKPGVRADGVDDELIAATGFAAESVMVFTVERWLEWITNTSKAQNLWHTDLPVSGVANLEMRKEQYLNVMTTRVSDGSVGGQIFLTGQNSANSLNIANICASQFNRATSIGNAFFNGNAIAGTTITSIPPSFGGRFALFVGFAESTVTPVRNANAEVFETVVVSAALPDADRQKLEGYLAWKWGLERKLPFNHPYRDFPPLTTPQPWTPVQLGSSLALWLDANDAGTITLNGGTVSQWSDKSGNGWHMSQATAANQPAYVTGGLNGKPVIRTDGADRLQNTTTSLFRDVGAATWVAVAKYPVARGQGNAALLMCSRGDANNSARLILTANPSPDGPFMGVAGRRLDADGFQTATSSTARIVDTWFLEVGQANYSAAQANHWTNGTQDLTGAAFQTAGNSSDTDPLSVNVFGSTNILAPAGTEIAEGIAIEGPLSTEDRQKIEGYLAHKWGLAANLPADHPHKTTPPTI